MVTIRIKHLLLLAALGVHLCDYITDAQTCFPSCVNGQYCGNSIDGPPLCQDCNIACETCNGPGVAACQKCAFGYYNSSEGFCRVCNVACKGCTGEGPGACDSCQPGFYPIGGLCRGCAENTFGENCTGTCHCLPGPDDCRAEDGFCSSYNCEWGWTGAPYCQTACEEDKFGKNCKFTCHCPVNDTCSHVNGLCSSGKCQKEYAGPGCQILLPKLKDPPEVTDNECGNLTVSWSSWVKDLDIGTGPIAKYILEVQFLNNSAWTIVKEVAHPNVTMMFIERFTGLNTTNSYSFRVNVRRKDGDKIMADWISGFQSDFYSVECVVPTTTTLEPPTVPPTPPPGSLFETFRVQFGANNSIIVKWASKNFSHVLGNVTLSYGVVGIGNCQEIPQPVYRELEVSGTGNMTISNLIPNRKYHVKAVIDTLGFNATENDKTISYNISTSETAPSGQVLNIQMTTRLATSVILQWNEPACVDRGGILLTYRYSFYNADSPQANVTSGTTVNKTLPLGGLKPYTFYNISLSYENKEGVGPPLSYVFQTEEAAPAAPTITSIISAVRSMIVEFSTPSPANGIIRMFELTYTSDFIDVTHKSTPNNSVTLSALQPYTTYSLKVRASTLPGLFSNYSDTNVTRTLEDIPTSPAFVRVAAVNESCLNVVWAPVPDTFGIILSYKITYSEDGNDGSQKQVLKNATSELELTICGLTAWTTYLVSVSASTSQGFGPSRSSFKTTAQGVPDSPPPPKLISKNETTITIEFYPVKLKSGPLTAYMIYKNDLSISQKRRKRAVVFQTDRPPGSPVAYFLDADITTTTEFVVGDNVQRGEYKNPPLLKNHMYDIYAEIISTVDNVSKSSYSKLPSTVTTSVITPTQTPGTVVDTTSNNTGIIVAVVVIILLIIIAVVVIVVILWYRRRNRFSPPQYELYENEKKEAPKVVDEYDPHKYWNVIYSLRESRHIIAGRELIPDDSLSGGLMNGSVPKNGMDPPVSFQQEFHELPHDQLAPWNDAQRNKNSRKNRFRHLLPYDHTRVILDPDENSTGDYINANFVKGYRKPHAYIAAQSPFDEETVLDFWRMLFQYNIRVVVMITNIIEDKIVKCSQYWPDPELGKVKYGAFILTSIDFQEYSDYVIRTVKIKTRYNSHTKVVHIFDFCSWPDHGVPDDPIPLLEFRHKLHEYHGKDPSPIVVHCGTGVSRTGTFIAIDSLLEQYKEEGVISVFAFVRRMRKDRIAMVRTVKQYMFIYEAIFEGRVAGDTRAGIDLKQRYHTLTMRNPKTKHSYLKDQFLCLQRYTRKYHPSLCSDALVPANFHKNRFQDLVPPNKYRPLLKTPGGVDRNDYINAVFLNSHETRDHFILTQSPLHTTVIDFWKCIYDFKINTIVMMENFTYEDDTCAEYWPEDKMKKFEPFFVDNTNIWQQENVTIRHFKMHNMLHPKKTPLEVRQFQFNAWDDNEALPKSKSMFLDLMDLVKSWQVQMNDDQTPILVHCKDGATHSGLFCAVWNVCETMKRDNDVDVFHTVKHMKRRRKQVIDTLDQYRYCYKTLWDFMNLRMPGGTLTNKMNHTKEDHLYNVGSLSLASYTSHLEYM